MKKTFTVPIALAIALFFITAGNLLAQPEIIFLSDDNKDDYTIEFLQDQGLDVTKFWAGSSIATWGADTITMLNDADLIIIGRSIGSSESQDSADRATYNALTTPVMRLSPWGVRNSRNHWFNSGSAVKELTGPAQILVAADPIFANVTLESGDSLAWFASMSDGIMDNSGDNQGTIVAQLNDSLPLLVRFDADKAFYAGGPDSAVAERIYFGMGTEPDEPAHFPLTRPAKQVLLNEVTRIVGIAQQDADYGIHDYQVLMLTDDEKDDYNFNFLKNNGIQIQKLWSEGGINNWTEDTLAMLDAADLVIIGRSVNSGEFGDSIERVYWNKVKAPMIYVSPYHVRNSRNHLFNSGSAVAVPMGSATALIPGDVIFDDVTLASGDSLAWLYAESNAIQDVSGDNQGTIVAQLNDSVPLVVRFDADKAFYAGGPDSAVAERVYFGFGIEPDEAAHFPLTKDAKVVYLAEIARILDVVPGDVVYSAPDYDIVLLAQDPVKEATQLSFLEAQGLNVNAFWPTSGNINTWTEDTIAIMNDADLVIVGRSVGSTNSQDSIDQVVWNGLTVPVMWNSPWACRNSRNNMFNSGSTASFSGNTMADVVEDGIFDYAPDAGDASMDWFVNAGDYILDVAGDNQGEWIAAQGDTIPFIVRFEKDKAFYAGGPDSAVAERVYFGFGQEGAENYFPLTHNAQAAYLGEIMNTVGGLNSMPVLFGIDNTLESLAVTGGTLAPEFSDTVMSYTVALGVDGADVTIEGIPVESDATVTGDGEASITADSTIYVRCYSGIGQFKTYSIEFTLDDPVIPPVDAIDDVTVSSINIYPNPFNDLVTIKAGQEINSIEVIDLQGKVVYQMSANSTEAELNLSDLNSGVYFIRTQTADQNQISRIIKN